MAIDRADEKLYSSVVQKYLYREPSLLQVVRDRSSELTRGDQLSIMDYKTTFTIRDLADHQVANYAAAQQMNDREVVLDLSQRKYYNFEVPFIDTIEAITGAQIVAQGLEYAGEGIRDTIESHLAAQLGATADSALTSTTISMVKAGTTVSNKITYGTQGAREAVLGACIDAANEANKRGWPRNRFVAMPDDLYAELVKYAVINKSLIGTGSMNDRAVMEAVLTPMLAGFRPITSKSLTGDGTTAGTGQFQTYFGIIGDTLHYAQQFSIIRVVPDPKAPVDYYTGVARFGAIVRENARRQGLNITITDS